MQMAKVESGNLKLFKKENKMTNELKNGTKVRVVQHSLRTILEENMEACKSCDHNVIIECGGGCFFPHNTPPCFRQAVESQTTVVQQLKAEIRSVVERLSIAAFENDTVDAEECINRLRELSAV